MKTLDLQGKKKRIFDVIQISNTSDGPSRSFDIFLVGVIAANILVMFLETFQAMQPFLPLLHAIEIATLIVFAIEYLLRLWTAEFLYPDRPRGRAVLRFLYSFDGVVELLTILPFFFLSGAVAFRMMRVVRIFHLFRINANYDSFNVITTVLQEKKNQIVSSLFIIFILMLASSLCMYSVEHPIQPESFQNAFSGMWWSVSALLTVGYGDIYPVTPLGRVMAVFISFLGVGAVAIPTGIISAGFVEQYTEAQGSEAAFENNLKAVRIGIDSRWLGKSIAEIESESGWLVLFAQRNQKMIRPDACFCVELDDLLGVCPRRKPAE